MNEEWFKHLACGSCTVKHYLALNKQYTSSQVLKKQDQTETKLVFKSQAKTRRWFAMYCGAQTTETQHFFTQLTKKKKFQHSLCLFL